MRTSLLACLAAGATLVTLSLCSTQANAQSTKQQNASSRPSPRGSVIHVVIAGDLECMQAAKDLAIILNDARRDEVSLVVLELGGNESRLDVVSELAQPIRDCELPVIVFLKDKDDVVGAGALCLGLIADECVVAPGMKVTGRAAGLSQAALAPDDTSWGVLTEELARWMKRDSAKRGSPRDVEAAVVSPSRPVWAEFNPGETLIVTEQPLAEANTVQLVFEREGHHVLDVDAKTAVRLKVASGTLDSWTMIANRRDLKAAPRVEKTISAALSPHATRAEALLQVCDNEFDRAKETLKLPWPARKDLSPDRYHDAALKGRVSLQSAADCLKDLERLLELYPEVMRRPAPGQTQVAGKPSSYAAKWRSLVQSRRDKIEKLAETADKFAGV